MGDGIAFCKNSQSRWVSSHYRGVDNDCELIAGANGFRLPFESEWEHAAKGGQNYEYAGSNNIDEVAWYYLNSGRNFDRKTHPVGQKKPNDFGLYDMTGNVWEWCADDYNNPGKHRPGASERAYRGGDFSCISVLCSVSDRNGESPNDSIYDDAIGLRLSRSLD